MDAAGPAATAPTIKREALTPRAARSAPSAARISATWRLLICIFGLFCILLTGREAFASGYGGAKAWIQRHRTPTSLEGRARALLAKTPLIDGHVDFPMAMRLLYKNQVNHTDWHEAFENGTLPGHVDLKRLRKGQAGGLFWSVYAPCPIKADDFSDENLAASVQYTLDQIDVTSRILEAYPAEFATNLRGANALDAFKKGQIISPLGIEGLHQIGNSASNLRLFRRLGVRYATLSHNCHNRYVDAAVLENPTRKAEPLWEGVSLDGRKLIYEMNRIGMIVDLSHVSDDVMLDVLGARGDWNGSEAPIIFSHSSAWSICPHPRNVKDHILHLVKERSSLVMINIYPPFISCVDTGNENGLPETDFEHANLAQIVRHIRYIGELIGYDYVGIGSDFDGIEELPEGFEDVTKYPDLVAALLRDGVSEENVRKVVGLNLIRVWKLVDKVSHSLQARGALVLEDEKQWH